MSQRISIVSLGLRGDTQPHAALGMGLQQRGFDVHLVGSSRYAHILSGTGVEFSSVDPDIESLLASVDGQRLLASGQSAVSFARWIRRVVGPAVDQALEETAAAVQESDCFIYSPFALPAASFAERMGVPSVMASFVPAHPTREFPALGLRRSLGAVGNRISFQATEQVFWQVFRKRVNAWRGKSLGLAPWPFAGPFKETRRSAQPSLYCFSPSVVQVPRDWPNSAHVTGYWQLDPPAGWEPAQQLANFVDADAGPIVYVGFGSMVPRDSEQRYRLVRSALKKSGARGVYLGDPQQLESDDHIQVVPYVPHTWLFPRITAAVHHGGASTVGASLTAGLPTVTCPHFFDQPFWGARVHALGAGPRPVPASQLTADNLSDAMSTAISDGPMRRAAADLGQRLSGESGIDRACDVIECLLQPGTGAPASLSRTTVE
ncbi:glycosyltransferase [Streptomyces erythrochromogenes]|uniref:glycosyltransferase n=1 Tax=Streptomyces erythrochromogenes TaxID=285574 RepID=UPI00131D7E3B|nr:glycosyltransferase [Streptomyces erythrochromogenes]MCX5583162.1 glycosyltransferase [Streptomyces erythrochromogenes]